MGLRDHCSVLGVVFRAMFRTVFCGVLIYDLMDFEWFSKGGFGKKFHWFCKGIGRVFAVFWFEAKIPR